MDFILQNHEFILGLATTLAAWLIAKITGKSLDKNKLNAALATILDVIQDIKTGPETANLSDSEKKQLAVERVSKALPEKHASLLTKAFGTIGGAVEFVFHNRKWLFSLGKVARSIL
jgi:hypothetical protein